MGTHPIFESDFDCLTEKKKQKPTGNRLETQKHTEMSNSKTPVENVLEAYKTAIVAAKIVANAQQLTQAVAQVQKAAAEAEAKANENGEEKKDEKKSEQK